MSSNNHSHTHTHREEKIDRHYTIPVYVYYTHTEFIVYTKLAAELAMSFILFRFVLLCSSEPLFSLRCVSISHFPIYIIVQHVYCSQASFPKSKHIYIQYYIHYTLHINANKQTNIFIA